MPDALLIDPLQRRITLHDRTWYGHILRGHPEMEHLRKEVEVTITSPVEIRFSLYDPDCRQYYSGENNLGLRIVVIVDVNLKLVKTAHQVKKVKGGLSEWSQPTQ